MKVFVVMWDRFSEILSTGSRDPGDSGTTRGKKRETNVMPTTDDPMGAVLQYVEAFNNGDSAAMSAMCADPMQFLMECRPMSGRGRQPPKTGGQMC